MDDEESFFNQIFELRFASKKLQKTSKKLERKAVSSQDRVLSFLKKRNVEAAKICAGDVLRQRREAANLLKLSAKLDGIRSKLENAHQNIQTAQQIQSLLKENELTSILSDVSSLESSSYAKLESYLENFGVSEYLFSEQDSLRNDSCDSVDLLLNQVAEAHSLNIRELLPEVDSSNVFTEKVASSTSEHSFELPGIVLFYLTI